MERYIGVKVINAKPMTRLQYNNYRHWDLPKDEDGSDEGYLVEYLDGGKPNMKDYIGYVSWSPKDVFESAYRRTDKMHFGFAIEAIKKGFKVTRAGWNGKGMWIALPEAIQSRIIITENSDTNRVTIIDLIVMKTVNDEIIPWSASQTDVLAEDWEIVG